MTTSRKSLGDLGEELACEYLQGMGHTIWKRGWRAGHCEVDIISLDGRGVHFVEVKSRVAPLSGSPLDALTYSKKRSLTKAAKAFLAKHESVGTELFFDAVTVIFDGNRTDISYYPEVFIPLYY